MLESKQISSSLLSLEMPQEVKLKPPLPPEARRPMSPSSSRPISPPPMRPMSPGQRCRRMTPPLVGRQSSEQVGSPIRNSPAWFHPVKSQSPPAAGEEKTSKVLPYKRQSSTVNEGVLDMLESLGDLSVSMSVPKSSNYPPPSASPEPIKQEDQFPETSRRTKKETGGCCRPMSVPAFSVFRRKTSDCLTERAKSPEKRPNSLQPRPTTPTNLLRPISPAPRRGATTHDPSRLQQDSPASGLIRPEPRMPASVFTDLQPRSRLSADYTILDQDLASFKPIEAPNNGKIVNQKSKFEPENEVRFKYFNESNFDLFPRTTIIMTRTSVQIFGKLCLSLY